MRENLTWSAFGRAAAALTLGAAFAAAQNTQHYKAQDESAPSSGDENEPKALVAPAASGPAKAGPRFFRVHPGTHAESNTTAPSAGSAISGGGQSMGGLGMGTAKADLPPGSVAPAPGAAGPVGAPAGGPIIAGAGKYVPMTPAQCDKNRAACSALVEKGYNNIAFNQLSTYNGDCGANAIVPPPAGQFDLQQYSPQQVLKEIQCLNGHLEAQSALYTLYQFSARNQNIAAGCGQDISALVAKYVIKDWYPHIQTVSGPGSFYDFIAASNHSNLTASGQSQEYGPPTATSYYPVLHAISGCSMADQGPPAYAGYGAGTSSVPSNSILNRPFVPGGANDSSVHPTPQMIEDQKRADKR
jgi:hypothetical protein